MKIGSKYLISGALMLLLVSLTLVGSVSAAMDSRPPPDRIMNSGTSVLPGTFDDHLGASGFEVGAFEVVRDGSNLQIGGEGRETRSVSGTHVIGDMMWFYMLPPM